MAKAVTCTPYLVVVSAQSLPSPLHGSTVSRDVTRHIHVSSSATAHESMQVDHGVPRLQLGNVTDTNTQWSSLFEGLDSETSQTQGASRTLTPPSLRSTRPGVVNTPTQLPVQLIQMSNLWKYFLVY